MFKTKGEFAENIVYKPCKKCGSELYDNGDCPDPKFTKDGKIEFEPNTCDVCDFGLKLSDSDLIH